MQTIAGVASPVCPSTNRTWTRVVLAPGFWVGTAPAEPYEASIPGLVRITPVPARNRRRVIVAPGTSGTPSSIRRRLGWEFILRKERHGDPAGPIYSRAITRLS